MCIIIRKLGKMNKKGKKNCLTQVGIEYFTENKVFLSSEVLTDIPTT